MLTSIIEQANQAVNDKFRIIPIKSTYSLYYNQEWMNFCANRDENPKIESLYLPRTYSAHLKQQTDFLDLGFLHEYYGHGLFCEYSKIGQKIVRFEKELAELEKLLLNVEELPENQKITVTSKNPYFINYKKLKGEYKQFFQEHFDHYEGFAYWLQGDLSKALNLIEKWEKLKQKMPEPLRDLFEQVNKFTEKNGEGSLMEWAGFC